MNHQDVLDWALEHLQAGKPLRMNDTMQAYVNDNPDLADELNTLALFWQPTASMPKPTPALRAGFYQELEHLTSATNPTKRKSRLRWLPNMMPMWQQFVVLVGVFVIGLYTGQATGPKRADEPMIALQQEVASLSTVMAISMLQDRSASQRLAGASYTKRADMTDPLLLDVLVSAFVDERSTPVKLAIIDAFNNKADFATIEATLATITLAETQPLVKMALTRLFVERASSPAIQDLLLKLRKQTLDPDVEVFINLIDAQNRI